MTEWKKCYSLEKPEKFDISSSDTTIYYHINIEKITIDDLLDNKPRIYYKYDECQLTQKEYIEIWINTMQANIDYISAMTNVDLDDEINNL